MIMSLASSITSRPSCTPLTGPGMRRHSSTVSSGRCTSWRVREVFLPLRVTCSFTTVVCPVSLDKCSAVSTRLGGKAAWIWQLEVMDSSWGRRRKRKIKYAKRGQLTKRKKLYAH